MHTFNVELNRLKGFIDARLRQPYLEKNIGKPMIDMDKIFILNYMYKQANMPQTHKQQYIITIMLIQIALDMHETVVNDVSSHQNETELQLSVLAGDFYSAHYYQLLSSIEDIEMINILAEVIKETSENKMRLYYSDDLTVEQYLALLSDVEALVFERIATDKCEQSIMSVIRDVLLLNKLERELDSIHLGASSSLQGFISQSTGASMDEAKSIIHNEIESTLIQLDRKLLDLPYFYSEFKIYASEKFTLGYKTSIAEEG